MCLVNVGGAFRGHIGDKNTCGLSFVNFLGDTLVTSRHIVRIPTKSAMTSIQTALELHGIPVQPLNIATGITKLCYNNPGPLQWYSGTSE